MSTDMIAGWILVIVGILAVVIVVAYQVGFDRGRSKR
jgi:1,4-dihydroxy-2-naphthoate octaprenyltransferase